MSPTRSRRESPSNACTLFVDPSCPYAWIASRWLTEVAREGALHQVCLGIVSLSVINEGRELEGWYREFNDRAWGPARVAAVVHERHGVEALSSYYEAYGELRHVGGRRDDTAIGDALRGAGLDPDLAAAATDPAVDGLLRDWTERALEPVKADVGTPVLHLDGAGFFGPVLTSIPRRAEAVDLFLAMQTLSRTPSFVEYKRGRTEELRTA